MHIELPRLTFVYLSSALLQMHRLIERVKTNGSPLTQTQHQYKSICTCTIILDTLMLEPEFLIQTQNKLWDIIFFCALGFFRAYALAGDGQSLTFQLWDIIFFVLLASSMPMPLAGNNHNTSLVITAAYRLPLRQTCFDY